MEVAIKENPVKRIPVIEMFGPVIQGEGAMIGRWTSFIRTGGCDFRCSKCDSLHAVDPEQVKKNSTWMTGEEIADKLLADSEMSKAPWVTFSGGNPAMWDLSATVDKLKANGYLTAVETQGSIFHPWLLKCNVITVSPKGNGMGDGTEIGKFRLFMQLLLSSRSREGITIKIPVFDEKDLDLAEQIARDPILTGIPLYLSLGNPFPPDQNGDLTTDELAISLLGYYRNLSKILLTRPFLQHATFLPQLHVLLYGNERLK